MLLKMLFLLELVEVMMDVPGRKLLTYAPGAMLVHVQAKST